MITTHGNVRRAVQGDPGTATHLHGVGWTTVEFADYQSRIATEAALLRAAAVSVSSDTSVPTCPGWTVQRLLQHVGRVFDMVIRVVQTADPLSRPARDYLIFFRKEVARSVNWAGRDSGTTKTPAARSANTRPSGYSALISWRA